MVMVALRISSLYHHLVKMVHNEGCRRAYCVFATAPGAPGCTLHR